MSYDTELRRLAELATGGTVLELGSAVGESTQRLAKTAAHVYAVDWHWGDQHNGESDTLPGFLERCRHLDNVTPIIGRFEDVCPILGAGEFDLVFLDGFHTYEAVKRDIELAEWLVARPGIFAFHDYGLTQSSFGVTQAVDERYEVTELVHTLAIVEFECPQFRKRSANISTPVSATPG